MSNPLFGAPKGYQAGDVVRLKTGGPWMTVTGLINDGDLKHPRWVVECAWFVESTVYRNVFPWHALEKRGAETAS